jgi:RNA polymerase sigma factor (sigma-70 family)
LGVNAGRDGFEEAFPELFAAALALSVRIVGSRAAAEDVAAEVMVRAYVHWRRIGEEPWRLAWVLRVASNLSLKSVARSGRRSAEEPAVPVSYEDSVVLRQALAAALAALPRRQREAVVLRFLADVSESDAARVLGSRPTTVRTHLRRGLDALRASLGASWEEAVNG